VPRAGPFIPRGLDRCWCVRRDQHFDEQRGAPAEQPEVSVEAHVDAVEDRQTCHVEARDVVDESILIERVGQQRRRGRPPAGDGHAP